MSALPRSAAAFQELIGTLRSQWANQLYPAVAAQYRHLDDGRTSPAQTDEALARIAATPLYRWFAFIERHYQRMKYSDPRWGLAATFEQHPNWVSEQLAGAEQSALLELDPDLPIPAYYQAVDIHQHPGNLLGAEYDGLMYQASATSIHPNTRRFEAHERFGDLLQAEARTFRSVLDMGCGFGKCSFPIAQRFPESQVIGIDLSAPCLKLAAVTAQSIGLTHIRFAQRDALRSGYPDQAFDLVTSTQLLHELPVPEIECLFAESFRLLEPGGRLMHLDFRTNSRWSQFLMDGHSVRNNEAFLPAFDRMDVRSALERAGFEDIRIEPFAETPGATDPAWPWWRFPWTLFSATRPPA